MRRRTIMIPRIFFFLVSLFFLSATGCGAKRPVLYPNDHLKNVGQERARMDIEECDRLAAEYVKSDAALNTAKSTGIGAAAGAAVGAAVGAVTGDAGRGAAAGAAGGGVSGFLHGLFSASEPSPVHKGFVERCLRDRGYELTGWQ